MKPYLICIAIIFIFAHSALPLSLTEQAYQTSYEYERGKDFESAITALNTIKKDAKNAYKLNLRTGWLYYLDQKYLSSVKYYQAAINCAPDSVEAKLGILYPLIAQKNYSEVESVCYQIITKDYYNYYANLRLAYVLRMQKKFELAKKVIYKMLEIYPTDAAFLTENNQVQAHVSK